MSIMFRRAALAAARTTRCFRSLSSSAPKRPAADRGNIMSVPLDGISELHPAVRAALSFSNASRSQLNAFHITSTIEKYRQSESDTGSPEVQSVSNDCFVSAAEGSACCDTVIEDR
jgi:hypothetical protein